MITRENLHVITDVIMGVIKTGSDHTMCSSRKISIPPPPTEGQWKFRWGGGLKGGNFRGVGGCAYEEFLQRVRK